VLVEVVGGATVVEVVGGATVGGVVGGETLVVEVGEGGVGSPPAGVVDVVVVSWIGGSVTVGPAPDPKRPDDPSTEVDVSAEPATTDSSLLGANSPHVAPPTSTDTTVSALIRRRRSRTARRRPPSALTR
jgi:hypothetical protein